MRYRPSGNDGRLRKPTKLVSCNRFGFNRTGSRACPHEVFAAAIAVQMRCHPDRNPRDCPILAAIRYRAEWSMLIPKLDILPAAQRELWPEISATPRNFTLYGGTAIALATSV